MSEIEGMVSKIMNNLSQKMVTLELNRLEQRDNIAVCYFMVQNQYDADLQAKLELFSFDQNQVINGHFLIDFESVPAGKRVVKLIPVKDVRVEEISSILINQLLEGDCSMKDIALLSRVDEVELEM